VKVYLDVDALHKLGAFNALNEVLAVLGVSSAEVWVPGTAKFKLRLKSDADAVKRHGVDTAARLRAFIGLVHEITEGPTEDEKRQLEQIPGLDAGELLLIAMAARSDESLIVTGDKNAMRALATEPRCAPFATRLAGRVICLVMGLTSTAHAGVVRKVDVAVAKNYLSADEVETLNLVCARLDPHDPSHDGDPRRARSIGSGAERPATGAREEVRASNPGDRHPMTGPPSTL
jgi:hypothetical protein